MSDPRRAAVPHLAVKGLGFRHPRGAFNMADVTFDLAPGSFTVVLGQNGSGKSTLARLLGGLLRPAAGTIDLGGAPLASLPAKRRGRAIAFLSQDEPKDVPFTAFEIVLMGRYPWQSLWPFDSITDRDIAMSCMERTDTLRLADRPIEALSGGERQRVYMARALAQTPRILILDEPASNLDLSHQVDLWSFLGELNRRQGLTVLAVSHEINLATRFADQIVLLKAGRLLAAGPPDDILREDRLATTYDVAVRALPDPESRRPIFLVRYRGPDHSPPAP